VTSDFAWCGDPHTFDAFRAHRAGRHVYYCLLERDPGLPRAIADRAVQLAANSTPLRRQVAARSGRDVLDGIGGIRVDRFRPDPSARGGTPLRVLVNGRRSRPKKGTDLILSALRSLARRGLQFETVLFDSAAPGSKEDPRNGARVPPGSRWVLSPTQDELIGLYQTSHVFVAAERKAGWCNTALEALACGAALACTRSGTTDFAKAGENAIVIPFRHPFFIARAMRRLLTDGELRRRLAAAGPPTAALWSWDRLATRLLEQVAAPV
jgi:glycosyltransferase involved in cell wall biosynthesis